MKRERDRTAKTGKSWGGFVRFNFHAKELKASRIVFLSSRDSLDSMDTSGRRLCQNGQRKGLPGDERDGDGLEVSSTLLLSGVFIS